MDIEISKNDWALGHPTVRSGRSKGASEIGGLGYDVLEEVKM